MAVVFFFFEEILENATAVMELLLFHVHEGIVPASAAENGVTLPMMNDMGVLITVDEDEVLIGEAEVIETDILGNNG